MTTDSTSVAGRPGDPAHRDPVLGLRQLRHPLQGVRPAGRAPRRLREGRRRRPGARVHRGRARPSRCTSPGTRSTTTPSWPSTPRTAASTLGAINANVFQDDDYKLGSVCQPRPRASARKAARPPARVRRHHGRHRVPRPQAVVRRRHQLPGPGRPPRPPGPPRRGPRRRSTPRLGDDQRMVLEYKLFEPAFYPPTCPTGAPPTPTASPSAPRRRWWSTPATTRPAPTSSSSWRSCCASGSSAAFDFNSRFYADDDLMVGAADPFQLFRIMYEVVAGGALDPEAGSLHARPVPQHRARRSPARSARS